MTAVFKPFADEAAVVTIGRLSLENRVDRISVQGDMDITRDKAGLKLAIELKTRVDQIVAALKVESLPDQIGTEQRTTTARNPFAPKKG